MLPCIKYIVEIKFTLLHKILHVLFHILFRYYRTLLMYYPFLALYNIHMYPYTIVYIAIYIIQLLFGHVSLSTMAQHWVSCSIMEQPLEITPACPQLKCNIDYSIYCLYITPYIAYVLLYILPMYVYLYLYIHTYIYIHDLIQIC
jgi:hypothetical protein